MSFSLYENTTLTNRERVAVVLHDDIIRQQIGKWLTAQKKHE